MFIGQLLGYSILGGVVDYWRTHGLFGDKVEATRWFEWALVLVDGWGLFLSIVFWCAVLVQGPRLTGAVLARLRRL